MPPLQEWHIHARAHACAITHRPFQEGERIASALYWRAGQYERLDMCLEAWSEPKNRLIPAKKPEPGSSNTNTAATAVETKPAAFRPATAESANETSSPAVPAPAPASALGAAPAKAKPAKEKFLRPVSHWQSTYERAATNSNEPMKKGDAEALLRRLLEEDNPAHRNVRYILALMLERKRILKPLDSRREDDRDFNIYVHAVTGDNFIIEDPGLSLQQLGPVQDEVAEMLKAPPV
ncbi:MAG: hypothetical protein ACAI35_04050 [Candidatus Methylacidiphilales bacterium]|nr:hypothetical protein [Candidatus Methylacidiphilales bacterium]